MFKFILGFVLGAILVGGIVWAFDMRVSLQDGSGKELGTTANPLWITNN